MTPSGPSVDTLGTLTVNAVSASGGQTITVSPKATSGNTNRYKLTPKGSEPTVNHGTVCSLNDHWVNLPESGKVTGTEGYTITVVEVDSLDKAVKKGSTTLPAKGV
nr:MAG TPA: hypothetical protein [Caudoviricetes sp.]